LHRTSGYASRSTIGRVISYTISTAISGTVAVSFYGIIHYTISCAVEQQWRLHHSLHHRRLSRLPPTSTATPFTAPQRHHRLRYPLRRQPLLCRQLHCPPCWRVRRRLQCDCCQDWQCAAHCVGHCVVNHAFSCVPTLSGVMWDAPSVMLSACVQPRRHHLRTTRRAHPQPPLVR
jgi:hypothetical protein